MNVPCVEVLGSVSSSTNASTSDNQGAEQCVTGVTRLESTEMQCQLAKRNRHAAGLQLGGGDENMHQNSGWNSSTDQHMHGQVHMDTCHSQPCQTAAPDIPDSSGMDVEESSECTSVGRFQRFPPSSSYSPTYWHKGTAYQPPPTLPDGCMSSMGFESAVRTWTMECTYGGQSDVY